MDVKTFTARTMAEALQVVRSRLGANAVVLHTRTYKRGGILGIGAKPVVEVTAADGREVAGRGRGQSNRSRKTQTALPPGRRRSGSRSAESSSHQAGNSSPPVSNRGVEPNGGSTSDLIRKTYHAAQTQRRGADGSGEAADGRSSFQTTPPGQPTATLAHSAQPANFSASNPAIANVQPLSGVNGAQLSDDMRAVRELVARMMHEQTRRTGELPQHTSRDELFKQYVSLIEQEMAEELAGEIVEKVRADHRELDCENADACRDAVSDVIADQLVTDDEAGQYQPTLDGRPRTIALVGPTGVGKTTTAAKLAADFKLKQNRRVGLLTLDTYRIAAVDQLKTYAGIIGVPLEIVSSVENMSDALRRLSDREIVVIDTAGRSQRDEHRLDELSQMVDAANPHETHLVLSATATEKVLLETAQRFSKIPTERVLFTKLDEAVTFGTLVTVARKVNKKLSYVTTGQEVPHDIEPGRSSRIASLILGRTEVGNEH